MVPGEWQQLERGGKGVKQVRFIFPMKTEAEPSYEASGRFLVHLSTTKPERRRRLCQYVISFSGLRRLFWDTIIQMTVWVVVLIMVLHEQFFLIFMQRHLTHMSTNLSLRISKKFRYISTLKYLIFLILAVVTIKNVSQNVCSLIHVDLKK